ncbi:MAG: flagellar motor protein PomA [Deltaproteobacteria bacterium]|nr:flagellar motor protein PomA [Deltaproteobacteria bacterium]
MDIATVIGLGGGAALIVVAILLGGDLMVFLNAPGMLIVMGGTIAACFIKFSVKEVINSIKVVMKTFFIKVQSPDDIIIKMVGYSRIVRKEGVLALEKQDPGDEFASKALRYISDGYEEKVIEKLLQLEVKKTVQRHTVGQNVFKGMGSAAPAFGMIGTLIGLVQMLAGMSDPGSIGPAMAVALLTTLYGAVIANLVCLPLADKLAFRCEEEQSIKNIIIESALGISQGINPNVLENALVVYMAPKERGKVTEQKK